MNESEKLAEQIIREWKYEDADSSNAMNLYQQIARHFYPHHSNILQKTIGPSDKYLPIIDPAGVVAADKMASGLYSAIIPSGQYFCRLVPAEHERSDDEESRSYLSRITQALHREVYKSNFETQFSMAIRSHITFGTMNIFSDMDIETMSLRYRYWPVSSYRFRMDSHDRPNRCWVRWEYTAQQAYELFGENAGPKVVEYATSDYPERAAKEKFHFIYRVQPRRNRNPMYDDRMNYPYEEIVVNEKEKKVVAVGGYAQFPHHISRWLVGDNNERWGYGQGAVALSLSKELQNHRKQLILNAELQNNPPREVLQSALDGPPKVHPGANNTVHEMNSIRALDLNMSNSFPINKDILRLTKDDINECFYIHVFQPLEGLTGDRRTTLEITERVKAGYMQMVQPVKRLYNECLTPLIERSVMLLLKYRIIPPPPPQLREFKVEYLGRLALALEEQQSDALIRFSQFAMQMEQVVPFFTQDNLNTDRAGRRMATVFGVNEGDLNTVEERDAIRQQRIQQQQQQTMMMAMQAAAKASKDGSTAPEAGSLTESVMAGA